MERCKLRSAARTVWFFAPDAGSALRRLNPPDPSIVPGGQGACSSQHPSPPRPPWWSRASLLLRPGHQHIHTTAQGGLSSPVRSAPQTAQDSAEAADHIPGCRGQPGALFTVGSVTVSAGAATYPVAIARNLRDQHS